jgi:hypothetical protein
MTSDEISMIKLQFVDEHLPRLKPIGEDGIADKQILQTQPKLRITSLLPPIKRNVTSRSVVTNDTMDSPTSSTAYSSTGREIDHRSILRNTISSLISGSPQLHIGTSVPPKRTSLYKHVGAKIDTGLVPRTETITRTEMDIHRLEPIRSINWRLLKQEIERDLYILAQTKRLKFNSGITYTTQLKTLGDLIRSKVKSHVSGVMGSGEERYKIVVHLTVFQSKATGLYIASRCLWNTHTDNSVTLRMYGVDCDILIVVFLCYTDLGAI